MAEEVAGRWPQCDALWMAAAVADFRPETAQPHKIPKRAGAPEIRWAPTEDILAAAGRRKRKEQILVGFAAETRALLESARKKMEEKNLDFIVANDVGRSGVGFDSDRNAVTVLGRDRGPVNIPVASKVEIAEALVDLVHGSGRFDERTDR